MNNLMDGMSMDLEKTNLDKLRSVFPECFAEGKLDIDKLLSLCGEYISNDFEKYKFEWKGKAECLKLAQKRSTGTLRPCPEESVDWDTTQNLYIEGDNLEVLKLLQTTYYRKVKMIYIDPPYNTGNDFVYSDDFADPMARYKEVTQQTTKSNPETMGRFHTNWLNMMYPRLRLAANLLRDDGVIFISIDDNEVTNLKKICDETFGEENFAGQFPWRKRTAKSDVPFGISQDYEWILCYAKSEDFRACLEGGTRKYFETQDYPGRPWRIHDLTTQRSALERPNSNFTMIDPKTGKEYPANPNRTWAVTKETFAQYYGEGRIVFPDDYDFLNISKPAFRYFKDDDMEKAGSSFGFIPVSTKLPDTIGMTQDGTKEIIDIFDSKVFGFPKPMELVKYLIKGTTATSVNDGDVILDFFAGSSTTGHAVMQLNAEDGGNRRYILVQLPEVCDEKSESYKAGYKNICEIGKERIRRAGQKLEQTVVKEEPLFEQEEWIGQEGRVRTITVPNAMYSWTDVDGSTVDAVKDKTISLVEKEGVHYKYRRQHKTEKSVIKGAPLCDVGFRVFKLDTSNLQTWDSTPVDELHLDDLVDRMNGMINRVKADRTDLDMVYEIMLKLGVPLTSTVNRIGVNGKTAYTISGSSLLLVCLAANISPEDVDAMAAYAPAKVIISRDSFTDDTAMANTYYILRDKGIELKLV